MSAVSSLDREVATLVSLLQRLKPLLVFVSCDCAGAIQQAHQLRIVGPLERLSEVTPFEWT
jgi:hypothetical protein